MEIIIHIGRHKTGTTSIQHFLVLNEELLLNQYGIYYPEIGRCPLFKYHHPLFSDWGANKKNDLPPVIVPVAELELSACK